MALDFEIELEVASIFRLWAFRESIHGQEDDGETFVLRLHPGSQPVYIKQYPLTTSHVTNTSLLAELKDHATRFVRDGMTPVLKKEPRYSIEAGDVDQLKYQQVVAQVDPQRWWIARIVAHPAHEYFYLLHWVGPQREADEVVACMATFQLEFLI